MKDASVRFFSVAESHPNPLLPAAASYEAQPPYHFIRRPRNVLTDPPNTLTPKSKLRAVGTPACCPTSFGEVVTAVRLVRPHLN
ncbi:hypothetical protein EVAR_21607_1 [Eumeta japonica]|uniref:Uncharacterized protein n=1 Tax=Eumeta variegata TaxID=151549 RepID=A0A4C1UY17_EUMVA|nr:hypothetical protein EVAR_21607_1 [Eumeta japonica]